MQTITRTISADALSKVMDLPKSLLGHKVDITISARGETEDDPFYCEENLAHLSRGVAALNAGKGVEHDIIEAAL